MPQLANVLGILAAVITALMVGLPYTVLWLPVFQRFGLLNRRSASARTVAWVFLSGSGLFTVWLSTVVLGGLALQAYLLSPLAVMLWAYCSFWKRGERPAALGFLSAALALAGVAFVRLVLALEDLRLPDNGLVLTLQSELQHRLDECNLVTLTLLALSLLCTCAGFIYIWRPYNVVVLGCAEGQQSVLSLPQAVKGSKKFPTLLWVSGLIMCAVIYSAAPSVRVGLLQLEAAFKSEFVNHLSPPAPENHVIKAYPVGQ